MRHAGRSNVLDFLLATVVLVLALTTRVWYLNVFAGGGSFNGPLSVLDAAPVPPNQPPDTERRGHTPPNEFDWLVDTLKREQRFATTAPLAREPERTAHVAPGYPWLVGWLERSPIDLGPVDQTVRWVQCLLGGLTAALYYLFARQAFGSRLVSGLSGILCAVHPYWVIACAEMGDAVLAAFLLGLAVYLGARCGQRGGAFASLAYGLTLAGLALVRATLLPFAGVAVLWYLLRCRTRRRGWLNGSLAFLGFVTALTPWTLRNVQAFGEVLPIVDSMYWHLWAGNSPGASGGPRSETDLLKVLADARGEDAETLAVSLAELPQPVRYRQLARDVWREVRSDPAVTLQRRLWATLGFVFGDDWLTRRTLWRGELAVDQGPYWFRRVMPTLLTLSLAGMLGFGLLGWRWTYGWRSAAMPSPLALLMVPLPYLLGHAEALHGPRLPLDGVLLTYAAFAIVCLAAPRAGRTLWAGGPNESGVGEGE